MAVVSKKRLYNWYICVVATMVMFTQGYDKSTFNAINSSENWLNWFGLDADKDSYMIGLINTGMTIGSIVAGWFFAGPVLDYFGRRVGILGGALLTVVATFMQAFAPRDTIGCFIGGRVLLGFGQGIALTSGPVYINEMAPADIRGMIMTFWQTFWSVGSFTAYWIAYAAGLNRKTLGEWDWRIILIFQLTGPILLGLTLPWLPDTPRWWIKRHNDVERARNVLHSIRDDLDEAEAELRAIQQAVAYEQELTRVSYWALFKDPSIRKRLCLAALLNVGQQLTGQGTLNSYSSLIYRSVFRDKSTINLINALNATFGILFTFNALWTVDRYGRRWLFLVGAMGMALCMLCVPTIGLTTPEHNGAKSHSVGIAFVFLLFLFAFFYKPSWGCATWIWTSEIFSVNVRAQAVGMCSQMQSVANTIFTQFFPKFLHNEGFKTFYFFMAVNLLLFAFVYFFIPETKQVAIEEIDTVFGGPSHVGKGADLLEDDKHVSDNANTAPVTEIQLNDANRKGT